MTCSILDEHQILPSPSANRSAQRIDRGEPLRPGEDIFVRETLQGELTLPSEDLVLVPGSADAELAQSELVAAVAELLKQGRFTVKDVQVLSGTNGGPLGVRRINILMQGLLNPPVKGRLECVYAAVKATEEEALVLREGDRVMQTTNDYDRKVFNGEIGTVTKVLPDETKGHEGHFCVHVLFEGAETSTTYVMKESRFDLKLAWCLTVHKAQGCEFPCVLLVVHPSQQVMHYRNWIYTGLTRARDLCVLFGSLRAVESCVAKVLVDHRTSGLLHRLTGAAMPSLLRPAAITTADSAEEKKRNDASVTHAVGARRKIDERFKDLD
jgi:exodeoxyribonuclease V alpha subunit